MKSYIQKTKCIKWSQKVQQRRINWFGHLCRLPENAPAKLAFFESTTYTSKPQGRPKTIWIDIIRKQLMEFGIGTLYDAYELAQDRTLFKQRTTCKADVKLK